MKRILSAIIALTLVAGAFVSCDKNSSSKADSSTATTTNADSATAPKDKVVNSEDEETVGKAEALPISEIGISLSQESGIYAEAFSLSVASADAKEIYYTTDGSDPRTSDTRIKYESEISIADRKGDTNVVSAVDPILFSGNYCDVTRGDEIFKSKVSAPNDADVDKCTTIRVAALDKDDVYSAPVSATYFIGTAEEHIQGLKESCEAAGQSLAVISLSMDYDDLFDSKKGIYVKGDIFENDLADYVASGEQIEAETARKLDANYKQKGRDWERTASCDMLEFSADGTASTAFSQYCGIRIQGNYSRSDLQKGFRLYARAEYGKKNFKYPVFGDASKDAQGNTLDKHKTLTLRAGGNCAFTAKFNDAYWQSLVTDLDCDTKYSRPCVVYLNGEYWGLYVLEEDYSDDFYEDHYGVNKDDVIIYKGDAEALSLGYKLDEGKLPEGEKNESYYYEDLLSFFKSHSDLQSEEDYNEFCKLVDPQSVMDYFAMEIWINNKWDWPGKNWSMWKTSTVTEGNEYGDGRWRFSIYDVEFGGVSGKNDAYTNTVKEDNYKPKGLLDKDTNNPAVLCYNYLMSNEGFRNEFNAKLEGLSTTNFEQTKALEVLTSFENIYSPLFDQFFTRYPDSGSADEALYGGYASSQCIRDFLELRQDNISKMVDWINSQY